MQNTLEEIRNELHSIRNILGPIDLKLDNLDHKILAGRMSFETRTSELDARIAANALRISELAVRDEDHSEEIAQLSERVKRIEVFLNVPRTVDKTAPSPVREDKAVPEILPPQAPPK